MSRMDDILKLKEMFPNTPVPIIHKVYTKNNCLLIDTCEELLNTSMQDVKVQSHSFPGTSNSGGAQGKYQDDDVVTISDSDEDKSDSEFSLKISSDKFEYLQAIFPDVQIPYLKRNLAEIGDDETKFQVFLNQCLTDPKRLPRYVKVTPSIKRSRHSDDRHLVSVSSLADAGSEQEAGTNTEEPSSSKKPRTAGEGKGLAKAVNSHYYDGGVVIEDKSTENEAEVEIVKESSHSHVQPPSKAKASVSATRINLSAEIGKFDKLRCPQCKFSGKMTHNQDEVRCNKCKKSSCRICLDVKGPTMGIFGNLAASFTSITSGIAGPRHLCSDSKMRELKSEMEHDLLRLAILSQTNPRDNSMKDLVEDSVNEFQIKNPENNDKDGWKKTQKSSQKIKDKEIIKHLEALYSDIDTLKICTSTDFLNECVDLLEQSALIPFMETMMDSCNFLEIGNHSDVYKTLIKILKIFCQKKSFHSLLAELPGQRVSIQHLIEKLGKAAKVIMDKVSGADVGVAQDIYELSIEASETLSKGDTLVDLFEDQRKDASSSSDECEIMELDEEPEKTDDYVGALSPLQYDDSVSFQSITLKHSSKPPSKKTVIRIAHELSSFATGSTLPCSASSTIFVRSDNSKMNFVKAVITGPSDSPYMGGIYEFDIEFPPTYPSVPPLVTFKTTAGGRVRFNPNLYASGKVCLSLLGTWSGEKWIPNTSTLLQVLVSIQSLVLVAEPYYNEPGFAGGHYPAQSKSYNRNVLTNNLRHAILEQLAKPPQGFEVVVRTHFYHRRESLIKELDEYVKQFSVAGTSAKKPKVSDQVQGDLSELVTKVKAELMKLEKPTTKNN